jgi:hypothetical protein
MNIEMWEYVLANIVVEWIVVDFGVSWSQIESQPYNLLNL